MAGRGDLYSRLVAWMKIILPLAALGLLFTLFLISSTIDPTQRPRVEIDLEQRAHEQGVTRPSFAGVTSGGDEVTFTAARARPDLAHPDRLTAEEVQAVLRLANGIVIDITARKADMHQDRYSATLAGDVLLSSSNGYRVTTAALDIKLDRLHAESPGPVTGTGPPGEIAAGRMVLTGDGATGQAELLFTDGVTLIYRPENKGD